MDIHFSVNFKSVVKRLASLTAIALVGGVLGIFGGQQLFPPDEYAPVSFVSVGVVNNTVPGVEDAALYVGDTLHYASALCINDKESVRVRIDATWREFTPVVGNHKDPTIDDLRLNYPAGCTRKADNQIQLPPFVTPGEWALEFDIAVLQGDNVAQVSKFATTRFKVLPKEGSP